MESVTTKNAGGLLPIELEASPLICVLFSVQISHIRIPQFHSCLPFRHPSRHSRKNRTSKSDMVGLSGVEPLTSRLSGARSNQLSYRPMKAQADWLFNQISPMSGTNYCFCLFHLKAMELSPPQANKYLRERAPARYPCRTTVVSLHRSLFKGAETNITPLSP